MTVLGGTRRKEIMAPPKIWNRNYPKKLECEIRDCVETSLCTIDKQKGVHGVKKPFACSVPSCEFRTKYARHLKDHQQRHDPALSTRYKCPMCEKGFPFVYEMERHVRRHVKEKLYECSECDYKCLTRPGVRSHVERRHGTGNNTATNTVTIENEDAENLFIPHEIRKDECGIKIYKCLFPGCAYHTKFSTNVAKHKTRHKPRNAKTLLKCTALGCAYETKWRTYYRTHLKLHDPNRQRNQVCPLCPKRFWNAAGLKRLPRTHTGEKVYKCERCEYASAESSNLYSHRRKYHPNVLKENTADTLTTERLTCPKLKQNPIFQLNVQSVPVVILKRIVIFKY